MPAPLPPDKTLLSSQAALRRSIHDKRSRQDAVKLLTPPLHAILLTTPGYEFCLRYGVVRTTGQPLQHHKALRSDSGQGLDVLILAAFHKVKSLQQRSLYIVTTAERKGFVASRLLELGAAPVHEQTFRGSSSRCDH